MALDKTTVSALRAEFPALQQTRKQLLRLSRTMERWIWHKTALTETCSGSKMLQVLPVE